MSSAVPLYGLFSRGGEEKESIQPNGYQRPPKEPNDDPGRTVPNEVRELELGSTVVTVWTVLAVRFAQSGEILRWPNRLGVVVTVGSAPTTVAGVVITPTGAAVTTCVGWTTTGVKTGADGLTGVNPPCPATGRGGIDLAWISWWAGIGYWFGARFRT